MAFKSVWNNLICSSLFWKLFALLNIRIISRFVGLVVEIDLGYQMRYHKTPRCTYWMLCMFESEILSSWPCVIKHTVFLAVIAIKCKQIPFRPQNLLVIPYHLFSFPASHCPRVFLGVSYFGSNKSAPVWLLKRFFLKSSEILCSSDSTARTELPAEGES